MNGKKEGKTGPGNFLILAHRGNLFGPEPESENTVPHLARAVNRGFSLEFDINFNREHSRLVLSHDENSFSTDRDPESFLKTVPAEGLNALNIKNMLTVPKILNLLEKVRRKSKFFLFDFELLVSDLPGCRFFMKALMEQGFRIAFRISERENFVAEYARDEEVSLIWLDEFDGPWLQQRDIQRLRDAGKTLIYVSPELHGSKSRDFLQERWQQVVAWGINGICTDYPVLFSETIFGGSHD